MSLAFNSQAAPPANQQAAKKKRLGLMKAVVGTNHNIRCEDGKIRQFVVRDYRSFPKATVIAICLSCDGQGRHRAFATADELLEAHPDHATMEKQNEAHVFVLWSDEPLDPSKVVKKGDKAEKPGDKAEKPGYNNRVGFLSDEYL